MQDITADRFTLITSRSRRLLQAFAAIAMVSMLAHAFRLWQLSKGFEPSEEDAVSLLTAVVRISSFAAFLAASISCCFWIYRAHKNVRALGATNMKSTPGLAVASFFIPFVNYFMPYLAMKRLWRASANPREWQNEPRSQLLPWWWSTWLLFNAAGFAASIAAMRTQISAQSAKVASVTQIGADVFAIPSALLLSLIIGQIFAMQVSASKDPQTATNA